MADAVPYDQRYVQKSLESWMQSNGAVQRDSASQTLLSIARSEEGCEDTARTCPGCCTDVQPACATWSSSPESPDANKGTVSTVLLRHDSSQRDCVASGSRFAQYRQQSPITSFWQTFHNHCSGARIDIHDIRENVDCQTDHIGRA